VSEINERDESHALHRRRLVRPGSTPFASLLGSCALALGGRNGQLAPSEQ
jgi:hypothetical protein